MNKTKPEAQGFTLVEIMIVVAIIGMLAAIAIPNYVKSREQAYRTTCLNNLRMLDSAAQQWAMENRKAPDQTVTYADLSGYLRNAVVCPAGGTTCEDSYSLTTVEEKPTCRRQPDSHKLAD